MGKSSPSNKLGLAKMATTEPEEDRVPRTLSAVFSASELAGCEVPMIRDHRRPCIGKIILRSSKFL